MVEKIDIKNVRKYLKVFGDVDMARIGHVNHVLESAIQLPENANNNDALLYNSTTGVWEAGTIASSTPSLEDVLAVGSTTGANDISVDGGQSIISGNGSGTLKLDNNSIIGEVFLGDSSGGLTIGRHGFGISATSNNGVSILSSDNSSIISGTIFNSVILGGDGITATESNTVYVQHSVNTGVAQFAEYTVATVPTASNYSGGMIAVTDEVGGYTMAFSDGTNWRRMRDSVIIS